MDYLADKLDNMVFKSFMSEPYMWRQPAVKPNGEEYYEYFFTM